MCRMGKGGDIANDYSSTFMVGQRDGQDYVETLHDTYLHKGNIKMPLGNNLTYNFRRLMVFAYAAVK